MATDVYESAYDYQYVRLTYTDLQTGGKLDSSGDIVVGSVEPGGLCDLAFAGVYTAAGVADDITLNVGYGATPNEFIAALDLDALTKATINTGAAFRGAIVIADATDTTLVNAINAHVNNTTTAQVVKARFGGTVANLTAGEWIVAIRVFNPMKLAKKL